MRKNEKITALYERLSRDDFGKDDDQQRESNSISNQKAMLEEFAARQGFTNIVHFTDDGISGTCFDRPGFLAMMKEVEAGNVEYLCIKDMSRMGRDYLKVGQIMEILRQRGVRLIAINDGVDSARGDDDFTPFRNIMEIIVMKGWVIAMQISGYSSAAMLAYRSSGMKQKAGTVKMQDFSQMVQNTSAQATSQTDKTAATKEVSEVDEMAAFKQEIYEELAEIDKMNSSAVLSNSVRITEGGFKRMKEDPAYRKEIMDWLRADARASHGLPYSTHSTTVINEVEARTRVVSNDLYRKDPATKTMFDQKAKDSFFHSSRSDRADRDYADRKAVQRKRDSEYVASERMKRELMQKMLLDKSIAQQEQHQAINQQAFQQQYLENYMLGMQPPKSWNI